MSFVGGKTNCGQEANVEQKQEFTHTGASQ